MTVDEAISSVIAVAKNEVGYLEKASNSSLYDKTANAGSANYTKYWAEIYPSYQGQPWCACFVTWCFVQAFGETNTKTLLKHYPYVYCPTLGSLFSDKSSKPTVGDIVIFYSSSSKTYTHTGIVTSVSGTYFTTIEGNTSSGSSVIANGGAVCAKGYYTSNLSGTKFCTPDYSILANYNESGDELMSAEYDELKAKNESQDEVINLVGQDIADLQSRVATLETGEMIYNYMDDNMPSWAVETIQKLMDKGYLTGDDEGKLNLTYDLIRLLVINDRAGLYGE